MPENEHIEVPDFSGDDLAYDKEVIRIREEIKADEKRVSDSISSIQQLLNLGTCSHKNLKSFLMFKGLKATIKNSFRPKFEQYDLYVFVVEYFYSTNTPREISGRDQYFFGHLKTRDHFPRTFVHKETIIEKLSELFHRQEVDFEFSPAFSRKFYVLTEDRDRLSEILQYKALDELAKFPEMELELYENNCLFRSSKRAISVEEAKVFSALARALVKIFA